jgi:hypothetical protein
VRPGAEWHRRLLEKIAKNFWRVVRVGKVRFIRGMLGIVACFDCGKCADYLSGIVILKLRRIFATTAGGAPWVGSAPRPFASAAIPVSSGLPKVMGLSITYQGCGFIDIF